MRCLLCLRQEEGVAASSGQETSPRCAGQGRGGGLFHLYHQRSVSLASDDHWSVSVASSRFLMAIDPFHYYLVDYDGI